MLQNKAEILQDAIDRLRAILRIELQAKTLDSGYIRVLRNNIRLIEIEQGGK